MNFPEKKLLIVSIVISVSLISLIFFFSAPQQVKKSGILLESHFNFENEYRESFEKFKNERKEKVLAAVTSHHFLAKDLIAQTFFGIDPINIKTVIIISPDHFQQIKKLGFLACTARNDWRTPFGILNSDEKIINHLLKNGKILESTNLFEMEHGVYVLIPFIKKTLPNVKIVPLVLKQNANYRFFYDLGNVISNIVNVNETILIMSSDFTHNASIQIAKQNDEKSIKLLSQKKFTDVRSITNDCPQCTAFLFGYLNHASTNFKLIFNQNSFDLSKENQDSVTSYVGAYFTSSP